jgi:hypothetical protein
LGNPPAPDFNWTRRAAILLSDQRTWSTMGFLKNGTWHDEWAHNDEESGEFVLLK